MSSISTTFDQLSKDIQELEQLQRQATQKNVQTVLEELLRKWRSELAELNKQNVMQPANGESDVNNPTMGTISGGGPLKTQPVGDVLLRPQKKLTSYAFDESDKFIKLYYTVPGISKASVNCINTTFHENSFQVNCINVEGIDYEIHVSGLLHAIDANNCRVKQKSENQLLVMLKKLKEAETWGSLLKLDKKERHRMPKMDESSDPQESLMNMMKQMYEEGDDDMKRTLRKTWHEAQAKKGSGGGFGDGMGME